MNKGFTLIEIIVAISVIIVGVVGIYSLVPHLVERVAVNQNKFIASQLAREGLEIVRNIRESNWLEQFSGSNDWKEQLDGCGGGCEADYTILSQNEPSLNGYVGSYLKIDTDGFYNYGSGDNTKFRRKITIDAIADPDKFLDVKVEVFYGSGEVFTLEERLYNWR